MFKPVQKHHVKIGPAFAHYLKNHHYIDLMLESETLSALSHLTSGVFMRCISSCKCPPLWSAICLCSFFSSNYREILPCGYVWQKVCWWALLSICSSIVTSSDLLAMPDQYIWLIDGWFVVVMKNWTIVVNEASMLTTILFVSWVSRLAVLSAATALSANSGWSMTIS